jgi:hypothetical protein
MGQLSDMRESIDRAIRDKGLDEFLVKGQISMKAGFMLSLVGETTPDNAEKVFRLKEAAFEVLGQHI